MGSMNKYKVHVGRSGSRWYVLNGEYHREDGPAIEHLSGSKFWFINGRQFLSKKEYKEYSEVFLNG